MKRELVQIWVTPETRQAVKVAAAKAGVTVVEYLQEQYGKPYEPAELLAESSRQKGGL